MPKYRLLEQHYSEEDKLLDGDKELGAGNGTVVGDGAEHAWTRAPTPAMVGLDDESIALVAKESQRGHGLNPIDYLPITVGKSVDDMDASEAIVMYDQLKRRFGD